jgi:hypothetical protein
MTSPVPKAESTGPDLAIVQMVRSGLDVPS